MRVYTIGFTKTSAERFFERLQDAGVRRIVDVRLNNVSQLAGFAKKEDLSFFLRRLSSIEYTHRLDLAPPAELLDSYRKRGMTWREYESQYLQLLKERQVEDRVPRDVLDAACLLCSEDRPERCHRRLAAEYLQKHWDDVEIIHL